MPDATAASRPTSRLVIALLGASVFTNVYMTQALLPELAREFQAGSVEVSLTVSATTLAMAVSSPLVGMLADSLGRKRVIVAALLALALPCLLIALSSGLHQLVVWRFVQGVLVPGVAVVLSAYAAEEFPPRRVPEALSAYIAGTVVGGFMGRFVTGLVSDVTSWRLAFMVVALVNLAAGVLALVRLPRSRRFVAQRPRQALPTLALHLRNPRLLVTCGVGFCLLFALVGMFTYVNFHLAAPPYGLGSAVLGSVFAVYLLGVVVTPPSGRLVVRFGPRVTLAAALGLSVLGFALTLASPLALVVVGLAVGSCGVFIAQATATGMVAASVTGGRSLAAGLYNAVYYAGGAVAAVVVGLAYTRLGWPGVVGSVAVVEAFAVALAWRAWRA